MKCSEIFMTKSIKKNVSAIILCGGKGTRLRNIGLKKNKTMLSFKGNQIMHHILKYLFNYHRSNYHSLWL